MIFWLASLLLMQVARGFFLMRAAATFDSLSFAELAHACLYGLRFDIAVLSYIFLAGLGIRLVVGAFSDRLGKEISRGVAVFGVALTFMVSLIDSEYYIINHKRLDASLLRIAGDIQDQGTQMARNYAYILFCLVVVLFLFWHLSHRELRKKKHLHPYLRFVFSLLFWIPLGVIGARGGLQEKPLKISSALVVGDSRLADLTLNSAFVLMQTINRAPEMQIFKDFPYADAKKILEHERPVRPLVASAQLRNLKRPGDNVVLIILESFGNEYAYATPFLNRLKRAGINFERHYSNGRTSIEAVPALLASLPSLLPFPYITSPYAIAHLSGLPSLIDHNERDLLFLHGARKGSMYFDSFTSYLGFNYYFGKEDYNGESSALYDWGVHDHAWLDFSGEKFSEWRKPFFATIFTLSSHQPYEIPLAFQNEIPAEANPYVRSLRYSDRALEMFFDKYKNKKWFKNTLFILTADHTSKCTHSDYCSEAGSHSVPLVFYHGAGIFKPERNFKISQHADIPATIADYLGLDSSKLLPLGHSLADASDGGLALFRDHHDFEVLDADGLFKLHDAVLQRCPMGAVAEKNCAEVPAGSNQKEIRYLRALRTYFTESLERRSFTD